MSQKWSQDDPSFMKQIPPRWRSHRRLLLYHPPLWTQTDVIIDVRGTRVPAHVFLVSFSFLQPQQILSTPRPTQWFLVDSSSTFSLQNCKTVLSRRWATFLAVCWSYCDQRQRLSVCCHVVVFVLFFSNDAQWIFLFVLTGQCNLLVLIKMPW